MIRFYSQTLAAGFERDTQLQKATTGIKYFDLTTSVGLDLIGSTAETNLRGRSTAAEIHDIGQAAADVPSAVGCKTADLGKKGSGCAVHAGNGKGVLAL